MDEQSSTNDPILSGLNDQQRAAVCHGDDPLLIIAGAGSGKTKTLVHRVAHGIQRGIDPGRILLLTFTRRAAGNMVRRVEGLLHSLRPAANGRLNSPGRHKVWGGTFHATAAQLLRIYGKALGLDPAFTIHDRGDSGDLMNVVRTELGLAKGDKRFPKKNTCMDIYSLSVNAQQPLEKLLPDVYPWCLDYTDELKRLFRAYVDRKDVAAVLDYDDLLLFWNALLADPAAGTRIRQRFDWVLVDEYQDTNSLQAEILKQLRPDGKGLAAVGDDAQSIYSFRAATIRNILDFPKTFPGTTVVKLEQNYRSTQGILRATNQIIGEARERFAKELWSARGEGDKPVLAICEDEDEQSDFLVSQILQHREAGIELRKQAVLFRASHHSILLEAALARHNIPFVKYGGLRFIEAAHVKDVMAFLRLAENPRDVVAGMRVLMLLPGIGPAKSQQLMQALAAGGGDFSGWQNQKVPQAALESWPTLVELMLRLHQAGQQRVAEQLRLARKFYEPLMESRYDNPAARSRDLEQIEHLAEGYADRLTMLAELSLDPAATSEDFAGPPLLDEDYLVLSTIHSAKGLEWDAVYVIHAADGNIPSDMSTKDVDQVEEERRLFYVALTRAKNWLYVCFPHRYYHAYRGPKSDQHGYAQLTRFITPQVKQHFRCCIPVEPSADGTWHPEGRPTRQPADIRAALRSLWS